MTEPTEYLIDTTDGQRTITIAPINVTPITGTQYATGQYGLTEGVVGVGTLMFNADGTWEFDGITDVLSDTDVAHIVQFIRHVDPAPSGIIPEDELEAQPPAIVPPEFAVPVQTLDFVIESEGTSTPVRVVVNYPFYDITINDEPTAQLEQDHHSNWFLTQGQLSDRLVQAIGSAYQKPLPGSTLSQQII
jgi:hypothetical protein